MLVLRNDIPATYFTDHFSEAGIKAAESSYRAWYNVTLGATWSIPQDAKRAHPKASILKAGRVVFNIKGNDYRIVCKVDYKEHIVEIRWFGSHSEYDNIDSETV